jgi:predicted permease
MESFLQDVRFAFRALARAPGYTAIALLTLALGIGATAAIFTVVNGVLLRPLPYADADRLVRVYQASVEHGVDRAAASPLDYADWRERTRAFSGLAAYWSGTVTLLGRGEAAEIRASWVTGDFFGILGTPVQLGRPLGPEDQRQEAQVAVIGDGLWRSRFGADPAVIGSTLEVGGHTGTLTIVGVASPALRFPTATNDLWMPQSLITADSHGPQDDRRNRYLEVVGRLAVGATAALAQAELAGVTAALAAEHPASNAGWEAAAVVPLREVLVGDVDRALLVVLGVVAFVLLIGCANLANLMMARASGRGREIAIRAALGAGRWRIVRQLSTEALVLALIGGVMGLGLALWGVEAILAMSADTLPRAEDVRLDLRVVGFGLAISLFTALLFGLLPALRVVRDRPQEDLRGGRGAVGAGGGRLRGALVVAQVTLAVLLVVGAGLMVRSFSALRAVDPGFDPHRVLTVSMSLNTPPSLEGTAGEAGYITSRKEELEERISALPGVRSVGVVHRLPLAGAGEPFEFTRTDHPAGETTLRMDARFVSRGYFAAMGVPLRAGELFDDEPAGEYPPIVLSEAAARRLWPEGDAVGRLVQAFWGGDALVVAVVGDVRQMELASEPEPAVYLPQAIAPRSFTNLVVRTEGDPLPLARTIRAIILEGDPNQPIRSIMTLGEILSESLARDRFFTLLFGIFGALALLLAAIGIYGVLAYSVGQRTREFGVRMALGARAADVLRMVIASGLGLVATGIVLGLLAAFALARLMAGLLYGVTTTDPVTFAAVPVLLAAVALLASYIPARRATRVDPMRALRSE